MLDTGKEVKKLIRDMYFDTSFRLNEGHHIKGDGVDVSFGDVNQKNSEYRERAPYTNVVGMTLDSLVGLAFSETPESTLSKELEVYEKNTDGEGRNLIQTSKKVLRENLMQGRAGVLVDFPSTEGEISAADRDKYYPIMVVYKAEDVVYWDIDYYTSVPHIQTLILNNGKYKEKDSMLECGLQDGVYFQRLWCKDEKNKWIEEYTIFPTDNTGNYWDEIPFVWFGSLDNTHNIDRSPISGIAELSVAHYNTSAAHAESIFKTGQPIPVLIGSSASDSQEGIELSASKVQMLEDGGDLKFVTAPENNIAREALTYYMDTMKELGARVIEKPAPGLDQTATSAAADAQQQNSILGNVANNVSEGITKALNFAQIFVGGEENNNFKIKLDTVGKAFAEIANQQTPKEPTTTEPVAQ